MDEKTMKSKMIVKIIIPVVIVFMVFGIWLIKNKNDTENTTSNTKNNSVSIENSDFALNVTEKIDIEKLKSYKIPIVIDFGSDSCIPCKKMAPVLNELNSELQGKAIVRFVDVWKNQSLAEGYPISVIPTQIFIDSNGKPFTPKDSKKMNMKLYKSDSGEHIFTVHEGGITKEELIDILNEMGLK